jgi:hypothetical protein
MTDTVTSQNIDLSFWDTLYRAIVAVYTEINTKHTNSAAKCKIIECLNRLLHHITDRLYSEIHN